MNVRDVEFTVEVVVEGSLTVDFVAGVDDLVVRRRLQSEVEALRGKRLDDVCGRATLENLATFLIATLADIGVTAVGVDDGFSKVTVFSGEVNLRTWPAELAFRRGVSLLLRKRERLALAEFSHAIDLAPRWPAAYNVRGRCFRSLKDSESARSDFERAIVLEPKFGEAHRNMGNILLEGGQATPMDWTSTRLTSQHHERTQGRPLRPPPSSFKWGLVLDGREHGGKLDRTGMMPARLSRDHRLPWSSKHQTA